MIAKLQEFYDKNRQVLHKIVPLDVPLTVQIEASSACDLRCKFCALSSETALKQRNHVMKNMSDETFSIVIEQLKEFPKPFKRVYFCGLGEVLVNPRLPDMIRQIKPNGIAPQVMIFTNAVNLTHEMSLALVDAGLDIMTISVNGLNSEDYELNCGRRIDYDKYIEQIAFLYAHKGNLRINLKTVDLCVNSEADKQFFFDTFGNICDYINIETIAPLHKGVDYSGGNIKNPKNISKFSSITGYRHVCVQPFRKLIISSLGKVNFCDAVYGFPYEELDIHKQRLTDIWNGQVHTQLLRNQLREIYEGPSAICENCAGKHNIAFEEENLDPYVEEILARLNTL
jgi:pyruvate-formate lyase-activating enzyme